jgi:hypothetical protein
VVGWDVCRNEDEHRHPIKDIKREQEKEMKKATNMAEKHSHFSIKIHNFYDTSSQTVDGNKKKCTHMVDANMRERHKCLHSLPIKVTKLELFKSDALMRLTLT